VINSAISVFRSLHDLDSCHTPVYPVSLSPSPHLALSAFFFAFPSIFLKLSLAFPEKNDYFMSFPHINAVMQEVNGMGKSRDTKKEKKKPPLKTPKEKRKEKLEKKNSK
jgi:hypothetical protein